MGASSRQKGREVWTEVAVSYLTVNLAEQRRLDSLLSNLKSMVLVFDYCLLCMRLSGQVPDQTWKNLDANAYA